MNDIKRSISIEKQSAIKSAADWAKDKPEFGTPEAVVKIAQLWFDWICSGQEKEFSANPVSGGSPPATDKQIGFLKKLISTLPAEIKNPIWGEITNGMSLERAKNLIDQYKGNI